MKLTILKRFITNLQLIDNCANQISFNFLWNGVSQNDLLQIEKLWFAINVSFSSKKKRFLLFCLLIDETAEYFKR